MTDDTIDAWVMADLARWTGNEASYVYAGQLVHALTLLQQTRAALRTRLSEHATEHEGFCACKMCVADRKVLAGDQ